MKKYHKRNLRNKNNNTFFEQIQPEAKRTDERLEILLDLGKLRSNQIKTGDIIKELRETLIKKKEELKDISETINKVLDGLK